jgi:hypothetical protein
MTVKPKYQTFLELHLTQNKSNFNICGLFNCNIKLTNSVAPEPTGSSPYLQDPATGPYPEPEPTGPFSGASVVPGNPSISEAFVHTSQQI